MATSPRGMVFVSGGRFRMGFAGLLQRGAAGPRGRGRRLLDGRAPGHGRRVPAFVRPPATSRSRSGRSTPPTTRTPTRTCSSPARWSSSRRAARSTRRLPELVGVRAGRDWRHPEGPESDVDDAGAPPGRPRRVEDAAAYAAWAGKELRPRRSGSSRPAAASTAATFTLGRRVHARWQADGEHVAGRVPLPEHGSTRLRGHRRRSGRSRPTATASSTWPATCGSGPTDFYSRRDRRARLLRARATRA